MVTQRCPAAIRCADPFHVVSWATYGSRCRTTPGLERCAGVARAEGKWTGAGPPRVGDRPGHERVRSLQDARDALWKNPENLTEHQHTKVAWIAKTDTRLIAPTCSKRASGMSFRSKVPTANRPWTGGSPGRVAAVSRSSYSWPDASSNTVKSIEAALDHGLSQGTDRIGQHQDPPTNPNRFRLPLTTSTHRPSHARPRRAPSQPAWSNQRPTDQSVGPKKSTAGEDSSTGYTSGEGKSSTDQSAGNKVASPNYSPNTTDHETASGSGRAESGTGATGSSSESGSDGSS